MATRKRLAGTRWYKAKDVGKIAKRNATIIKRARNESYGSIAEDVGLSRQRVHQIVKEARKR